jgi:HK97 gp10 family phage protein
VPVAYSVAIRMKKRLEDIISREKLAKFLEESAKFVFAEVRERAPVRTGRLRESITLVKVSDLHYVVGSSLEYAVFVEKGTRPHIIRPKRARALRFTVGGQTVFAARVVQPSRGGLVITPKRRRALKFEIPQRVIFAKKVEHPGTAPQSFFLRALQKYRAQWKKILRSVMGGGGASSDRN